MPNDVLVSSKCKKKKNLLKKYLDYYPFVWVILTVVA